jgi:hypothetical protein
MYEVKDKNGKVIETMERKPTAKDLLYTLVVGQRESIRLLKEVSEGVYMLTMLVETSSHDDLVEVTKAVQSVEQAVRGVSENMDECSNHWQRLLEEKRKR